MFSCIFRFLLTLKIKLSVILPTKWVYLEIAWTCNSLQVAYGRTGESREERGPLKEKRGKLGKAAIKKSPLEETRSSKHCGFSLVKL